MHRISLIWIGLALASATLADELSTRDFNQASRELAAAAAAGDGAAFARAVDRLAGDDSQRAVRAILAGLESGASLGVYDAVRAALASMSSEPAREELLANARRNRNWRVQFICLDVVSGLEGPAGREVVVGAFADRRREIAIHAYRLAGEGRWTEAVDPLIEALERCERRKDEDRQGEIHGALSTITDRQFPTAELWKIWWDKNREGFRPGAAQGGDEGEGVLSRIKRRRFDDYRYITEIGPGEVVVVEGVFDHVQEVLGHLEIPHTVIARTAFADHELDPKQILIFNCHELESDRLSDAEIASIRRFVGAGGYLFTSDWDLQNVAARAFPKHLGVGAPTDEHLVKIQVAEGVADHPLMKDVFGLNPYEHASMTWQIDGASFLIEIKDRRAVQPLVVSNELHDLYRTELVAVTFQVRDNAYAPPGRVLHVLSHFDQQRDEKGDRFALQQLLLNFFIEKKKTWARLPARGR